MSLNQVTDTTNGNRPWKQSALYNLYVPNTITGSAINFQNLSGANAFIQYAKIDNLTGSNQNFSNLSVTNLTATNIANSYITASNSFLASSVITNLTATNNISTYINSTAITATNILDTNLISSVITGTNIYNTNLISSVITGTNLISSNLSIANITASSSLYLPTSGGTATNLNYYEEKTDLTLTFTGIWASSQVVTAKIVKVGAVVTIVIPLVSNTANTASIISAASSSIPSRFCPGRNTIFPVSIVDSGVTSIAVMIIGTDGALTCELASGGNFTGSGTSGFNACSFSWTTL